MANANNTVRAAIADQAADWLVLNRGGGLVADPPAARRAIGKVVVLAESVGGQLLVEPDLRCKVSAGRHQRTGHVLDIARLVDIDDRAAESEAAHRSLLSRAEYQPAQARVVVDEEVRFRR